MLAVPLFAFRARTKNPTGKELEFAAKAENPLSFVEYCSTFGTGLGKHAQVLAQVSNHVSCAAVHLTSAQSLLRILDPLRRTPPPPPQINAGPKIQTGCVPEERDSYLPVVADLGRRALQIQMHHSENQKQSA